MNQEIDFIEYESYYNTAEELIPLYPGWKDFQPDLDDIFCDLEDSATKWCADHGQDFKALLEIDERKTFVEAIISVTGDDEIQTTNCQTLPPLHFVAAEILSKIKLSDKDTGVSNRKGNYTEGWIILPPNREASFDSVNRRHQNDGVGLALDIPKLRQASAVRKQNALESDLESKFKDLYKFSEWVDPDWLTYDLAQLNLVLATAIFDLRDAATFPFLYGTDGGCGGKPPWDNIDTAISGLFFHKNGKSRNGILGLMDEIALIYKGKLKPKNSVFAQATHYVQTGNSAVYRLHEAKSLLKGMTKSEQVKLLDICKGDDPLPESLVEKSVTIEPENRLIGSVISELRKNGLVMTELDVRLKRLSEEKFFSLLGKKNMGQVKLDTDARKKDLKRVGISLLAELSNGKERNLFHPNIRGIISEYYSSRAHREDVSSLSYAGIIRVFKTSDVISEFKTQSYGLSDEIITGLESNLQTERFLHHTKYVRDFQLEWLENNDLVEIVLQELPPGFGPDDARIARKLLRLEKENTQPFLFCVITEDRAMIYALENIAKLAIVKRYPREEYFRECLFPLRTGVPVRHFDGKHTIKSGCVGKFIRHTNVERFIIVYDFPNIERAAESFGQSYKGMFRYQGGYLKRSTLRNNVGWSETPWSSLSGWKDFQTDIRSFYGPYKPYK